MATAEEKQNVKEMLIKQLRLRMEPSEVEDDAPLFGEGLGLDSIDAIELVAGLEQVYGVTISSEEEAKQVFRSVETLSDFLATQGAFR